MCGIAGIFFKTPSSNHVLGKALIDMLDGCQHRGLDSTGFALYEEGAGDLRLRFIVDERDEAARQRIRAALAAHNAAILTEKSEGASFVNRMLAYDWRYTLAENDLPKVRSATQLAGVSVGYPFLDQALMDFSLGLPTSYKLKGLKLRWFFKEALRGFLPDEIISKKKHGFGLPFGVWAVGHAGLQTLAVDSMRGLGERGIVRREFTAALMKDLLPSHPGYYGEMVWILMMLEQWFRHHLPNYRLDA